MDKQLIDINDIRMMGRRMSMQLDENDVYNLISEAQENDLKMQLGNRLYSDLLSYINDPTGLPNYSLLLNGGSFQGNGQSCGDNFIVFKGIKAALVYYTQARLVRFQPTNITRFGVNTEQKQYSQQSDFKERDQLSRELKSIADRYMQDNFNYMRLDITNFPDDNCCGRNRKMNSSMIVTIIGK